MSQSQVKIDPGLLFGSIKDCTSSSMSLLNSSPNWKQQKTVLARSSRNNFESRHNKIYKRVIFTWSEGTMSSVTSNVAISCESTTDMSDDGPGFSPSENIKRKPFLGFDAWRIYTTKCLPSNWRFYNYNFFFESSRYGLRNIIIFTVIINNVFKANCVDSPPLE